MNQIAHNLVSNRLDGSGGSIVGIVFKIERGDIVVLYPWL
jgi:hypothetical protein